jgi:ATP-dependent Clp protease adaptor protein ClpS
MEDQYVQGGFAFLNENRGGRENQLVLYDDNVNSFSFVRSILMRICRHQPDQAEQCTLIVHLNGKCPVKKGSLRQLRPYLRGLIRNGLKVEII